MFGSAVLEVGIGLALVFLLASIVMTAAQEGIETILQTRAAYLQQAVRELMQGDQAALEALYKHPLVFALYRGGTAGQNMPDAKKLPAYIPREVFSAALIDMIETGEAVPNRLRDAYEGLARLAGGDSASLRREVEGWYDGVMDRASGWFKKRTQRNVFLLGIVIAVLLNINAVSIAQYLNANDAQRLLVVGAAKGVTREGPAKPGIVPLAREDANKLHSQLSEIGLPIGWSEASLRWLWPPQPSAATGGSAGAQDRSVVHALLAFGRWLIMATMVLCGWVITALAMMLGAPFWFDVLNRLMVIRSTVKPTEKSPDEPSEDGGKSKVNGAGRTGDGGSSGPPTAPEQDRIETASAQPIYG
jgi:hypothetical protein